MDTVIILKSWNGAFEIRQAVWSDAVQLGMYYNFVWTPAGTVSPEGYNADEWDGHCYEEPLGQRVTQPDACGLSDALNAAIYDLPDEMDEDGPIDDPWNVFVGRKRKKLLRTLADFCLHSQGFRIVEQSP